MYVIMSVINYSHHPVQKITRAGASYSIGPLHLLPSVSLLPTHLRPQPLETTTLLSTSMSLTFLDSIYKCGHMVFVSLCPTLSLYNGIL